MTTEIVRAVGLRKTYGGAVPLDVLHGIDLSVCPGEFVAIIGQSGSGKSTLLNILGCLDVPTGGSLQIDGDEVSELGDNDLANLRSEKIGFVFQFHYLIDELTCLENALLPLTIRSRLIEPEAETYVRNLLDRVGLTHQLDQTPDTMSGGQNQRCALVRALASRPRLILADEPTGNLDRDSGEEVFRLLREISHETGVAVVMVTHDERLAGSADRVVAIEDGRMHAVTTDAATGNALPTSTKTRHLDLRVNRFPGSFLRPPTT